MLSATAASGMIHHLAAGRGSRDTDRCSLSSDS